MRGEETSNSGHDKDGSSCDAATDLCAIYSGERAQLRSRFGILLNRTSCINTLSKTKKNCSCKKYAMLSRSLASGPLFFCAPAYIHDNES
jgi:hypothetical protein